MQKNKVAAFTISELLVVLVITTIVVAAAFSVLNIVQRRFYDINEQFEKQTEFARFKIALAHDFSYANSLYYNNSTHTLTCFKNSGKITYRFLKNMSIIRNQDTLAIELDTIPIFRWNTALVTDGKIDAILVTSSKKYRNKRALVFKKKDMNFILENNGF